MQTLILAFATVTQTFALPPGLINAICYVESHHKPAAINAHDGGSASFGVCQIKLATARDLGFGGTADELRRNDVINVYYAAKYLKQHSNKYNNDYRKAVSAYNAGKHRVDDNGVTKNHVYVAKVFKAWAERR